MYCYFVSQSYSLFQALGTFNGGVLSAFGAAEWRSGAWNWNSLQPSIFAASCSNLSLSGLLSFRIVGNVLSSWKGGGKLVFLTCHLGVLFPIIFVCGPCTPASKHLGMFCISARAAQQDLQLLPSILCSTRPAIHQTSPLIDWSKKVTWSGVDPDFVAASCNLLPQL